MAIMDITISRLRMGLELCELDRQAIREALAEIASLREQNHRMVLREQAWGSAEAIAERWQAQQEYADEQTASLREQLRSEQERRVAAQEAITLKYVPESETAEARISELETQLAAVPQPLDFPTLEQELYFRRQFLTDVIDDMECLPGCDSVDHEELCPVTNPMQAFRQLREQLSQKNEFIRQLLALGLEQGDDGAFVNARAADQAGLVEVIAIIDELGERLAFAPDGSDDAAILSKLARAATILKRNNNGIIIG